MPSGRKPTIPKRPTIIRGQLRLGTQAYPTTRPVAHTRKVAYGGLLYGRTPEGNVVIFHASKHFSTKPEQVPAEVIRELFPEKIVPKNQSGTD